MKAEPSRLIPRKLAINLELYTGITYLLEATWYFEQRIYTKPQKIFFQVGTAHDHEQVAHSFESTFIGKFTSFLQDVSENFSVTSFWERDSETTFYLFFTDRYRTQNQEVFLHRKFKSLLYEWMCWCIDQSAPVISSPHCSEANTKNCGSAQSLTVTRCFDADVLNRYKGNSIPKLQVKGLRTGVSISFGTIVSCCNSSR